MKNMFRRVVTLLLLVGLVGCNGSSPVAPSKPEELVRPPADPSKYLQIPTDRTYLLSADGSRTTMWFRVLSMTPVPGSEIRPLPVDIQRNCFYATIELGVDAVANPEIRATFTPGFGAEDGVRQNVLVQYGIRSGSSESVTVGPRSFDHDGENVGIPNYLVVDGKTTDDSSGHVVWIFGSKSLPLGYRPM